MFAVFFLLLLHSYLVSTINAAISGCDIDPFQLDAPMLIENGKVSVIYPKYNERTVKFQPGDTVELSCAQRYVVIDENQLGTIVKATCLSDQRFNINGGAYTWNQISCNHKPLATGRFAAGNCGSNGRSAEIGFVLDDQRFLRTMRICFDTTRQSPLYSQFELSSTIAVSAVGTPRPSFSLDEGFYNVYDGSVKHLYVRETQRSTINNLLGLTETSDKYIHSGDLLFLSKGHLTANSDFVYAAQKNSTFRYINTAPQWQTINGFNWNKAEIDTRNYASANNVSLQVWTGTYGVATLPHEQSGQEIDLYLYVHSKTQGIPVPALFWKLVYNPVSKRGIVLIAVNNPYLNQTSVKKNIICNDIAQSVKWLKWDKTDILHGYCYACAVPDFRKVVTYAPSLKVSGLLV